MWKAVVQCQTVIQRWLAAVLSQKVRGLAVRVVVQVPLQHPVSKVEMRVWSGCT
jgi:hypothetical protein